MGAQPDPGYQDRAAAQGPPAAPASSAPPSAPPTADPGHQRREGGPAV